MTAVKIGIQNYKIKQGLHKGTMLLHMIFDNPSGSCEAYANFLKDFENFLNEKGYSFKA